MVQANTFQLATPNGTAKGGVSVTYATTSIDGSARLGLTAAGEERHFRGDEIQRVDGPLGALVTVTLEVVPDAWTRTFTLVVPTVNCGSGDEAIQTFGVFTTARSSIAGPGLVQGAIERYELVALEGVARALMY
jgi:hypothetical protein